MTPPPNAERLRPPPPSIHWWTLHGDAQRRGNVMGSHITAANVAALRPRARAILDGPVVSVPAIVENEIYVGTGNARTAPWGSGGTLYKLDLFSGRVVRRFTFATPPGQGSRQRVSGIACTPAVADGRVYFSGLDGQLYCLDAETLRPLWITDMRHADRAHRQPVSHPVTAEGWSSPLVVGGRVYVGWGEAELDTLGFVYCLDAETGEVLWLFCTCLMKGMEHNEPNVIPAEMIGLDPLPAPFKKGPAAVVRGAAPWSSAAYDAVNDRIVIGTGSQLEQPLPQPKYCMGALSLDATTGGDPRFFQPEPADNYRDDDDDTDVSAPPMIYELDGGSVVAIGAKGGSFFLLDAETMQPRARRQLLPRAGGNGGFPGDDGMRLPRVDPRVPGPGGEPETENFYGIFASAAVHPQMRRVFVGVGGFAFGVGRPGIDPSTTAFLRALDWEDLTDAWPTAMRPDGVRRYTTTAPPMYVTPGEAGFASPTVVNDVVLMTTSRPGLYAFDAARGFPLWVAPGFGAPLPNSFTLGPAVYGDFVVVGSANLGVLVFSL